MGLLEGKVAIVTGSGGGIGRAEALLFAREGAKVVVNDVGGAVDGTGGDAGRAQQVVDEIKAAGGKAVANYGDVSDFEQGQKMVQDVVDNFGKIDILVHVAGILRDRMIFNMTESEWDAVIKVHLKGFYNVLQPASILFRQQRSGRVIAMSSTSALGAAGQPNYAAAKAGILGLIWSTANGLSRYNVTANAIMPSGATRMIDSTPRGRELFEQTGKWPSEQAVGTERDPDNVAPLVVFLASDAAQNVNGQCFASLGYQIVMLQQPRFITAIRGKKRWEPEQLAELFPKTLGAMEMLEPPAAGGFSQQLQNMPDDLFTEVAPGVLTWKRQ